MPEESLHHDALVETARQELDRAHRGVLAVDAAEIRRGLSLALTALQAAQSAGGAPDTTMIADAQIKVQRAMSDLDAGALAELGNLVEAARTTLI